MLMNHLRHADLGGRLGDLPRHGRDLFRVHDGRRVRLSAAANGWKPHGLDASRRAGAMITTGNVHLRDAHKTPQFWLIWAVLLPERLGRHRHHRRGLAHAAGDLRRQVVRRSVGGLWPVQRRAEGASCAGRRVALSACSLCSTSPGASSGRRCRTRSGGSSPTSPSSRSASSAMPRPRRLPRSACSAYSRPPSASSPRCMAEGSPPSLPISPISSARNMLARFTGGC